MADIVIINPRFDASFWGLEHALPLIGKRANLPVAALPLLAALTPPTHQVTLIDENVEAIDFARCARADIVGVTGMSVQRQRMREILTELKARGVFTAVGGPWVTVSEDYFGALADVIFIGEAEETWPRFLADWQEGRVQRRYEQAEATDMSTVPAPRLDLLKTQHYLFGSVQFTRGCPFQCEFCDIIVIFGRRPRLKTAPQIIAELEGLRARKFQVAFIVDDNLIGNKKGVKDILRHVARWQQENGYPLTFFTEASLDLADDSELMTLMVEANIAIVFVGIESPNEDSLRETKKLQNVRAGGTLVDKVKRVQAAGIEVWAGMILGFDNDDATVFDAHRNFLTDARISTAMVGMLSAIPKTPLHARLAAEDRLDGRDPPEDGTNVLPLKMSRAALRQGYVQLMAELYEAGAYFDRLDALYLDGRLDVERAWRRYGESHPWHWRRHRARLALEGLGLLARLMLMIPDPALKREYRRRVWQLLRQRPDAALLRIYAIKAAMHYHVHQMTRALSGGRVVNTF